MFNRRRLSGSAHTHDSCASVRIARAELNVRFGAAGRPMPLIPVVGQIRFDRVGAIELFQRDDEGEFVLEGEAAE